jgi:hypothetical protein
MQKENNNELSQEGPENQNAISNQSEVDKEAEKLEKIERERKEILNSAVSGKIDNLKERVAYILNNYVPARNSDIKLAWMYWNNFEGKGDIVTEEDMLQLTKISSLSRIRAKIQNEYKLFQANEKVRKFRGKLEESKKQQAIEDKPSYPLYSIYIDETGKNQKYLSVGSLWVTDAKAAFFAYQKLKEWKRLRNIEYEFHFAEFKGHNIEQYKEFFLEFLSLFPSVGFKVIIVDRSGNKNINKAIEDLTFHVINNGIEHENESGRAPLPRMLHVCVDNEEQGSDKLKLENLKERIRGQQIEGLVIHEFEALDSEKNIYLQIVDLFISSINRKLHSPNEKKDKDELANYILGLLNFKIEEVDTSNSDADKSKVFNLTYRKKAE